MVEMKPPIDGARYGTTIVYGSVFVRDSDVESLLLDGWELVSPPIIENESEEVE